MPRVTKQKWNWINAKVKEGSFLRYLKDRSEAPEGAEIITDSGKTYEKIRAYKARFTGFGILDVEQLDFRLLEVVMTDYESNEKFTFSVPLQAYGASYNLVQRLKTIQDSDGFLKDYEVSPYDFEATGTDGRKHRNRGFTVKDGEGTKIEAFKFLDIPEVEILKEATAKAKAVYDDSKRFEYLENRIIEIQKSVHAAREQVPAEIAEKLNLLPEQLDDEDATIADFMTATYGNLDIPADDLPFN